MLSKEIRALTTDEVGVKLDTAYQELFNLRFQMSTGQMKNTTRLTLVKRDIARLKTILRLMPVPRLETILRLMPVPR